MTKTITRRAALAGAAVTLPAAAVAAPSIASDTDPHPAWLRQYLGWDRIHKEETARYRAIFDALPEGLRAVRVQVGSVRGLDGNCRPIWADCDDDIDDDIDRRQRMNADHRLRGWQEANARLEERRAALKAALAAVDREQDAWLRDHGWFDHADRADAAMEEMATLADLIIGTPAATRAGLAALAALMMHHLDKDAMTIRHRACVALAASLGVAQPATVEG